MIRVAALLAIALAASSVSACSSNPDSGPSCDLQHVPGPYCADAHELALPDSLPLARGNKYADNADAVDLGFHFFFATQDLGSGIGCATCHAPELAFTDRLPVSKGLDVGSRNAPTIFNVARLRVFFWDGRADSLWSQPLFAIENPIEIGSTRVGIAHFVADNPAYRAPYERAFGPLPDMTSWPAAGKPGDAAYDALSADVKDQINRIAANIGKALEAYMRKNTTSRAPVDAFLNGDSSQMIEAAQRGLAVFLKNKCQSCHSGPMLTDEKFHNVGFPSLPGAAADPGRAGGLPVLASNVFNLAGAYADPGPDVPASIPAGPAEAGAFRTPSLRNVTRTPPYGHDGALATLPDVLAVHAPGLGAVDQGDLLAFMESLNGLYPLPPWNNWPSPQ
jgi:cytochrome c peroxidase